MWISERPWGPWPEGVLVFRASGEPRPAGAGGEVLISGRPARPGVHGASCRAPSVNPATRLAPCGRRVTIPAIEIEMTRPHATVALFVGLTLLLPVPALAEEALRVSGTGTALGAMRLLAASYEKANPGRQLRVLASVGSGGAFKAVAQGALDVGISARSLRKDEFGLGLVAIPYARTPFLFAAGPRAGVTGVTSVEVARMLRGELTRWPNGERVRVVLRPRSDADTQLLLDFSPELGAAVEAALGREGMLIAGTNQECIAMLVRTPGSIGPTSLTQILTEGLAVTPLAWDGVAPTLKNLDAGAYPLAKTLYLVIRAPAPPRVRQFVGYLATPEARRILEKAGNLPIQLPPLE